MTDPDDGSDLFALTEADLFRLIAEVRESDIAHFSLRTGNIELTIRRGSGEDGGGEDGGGGGDGGGDGGAPVPPSVEVAAVAERAQVGQVAERAEVPEQGERAEVPEGAVLVRSPLVGIFYRHPSPGEPPFVEVGTSVTSTATVGLVEAMKVFTSVPAGVAGTVVAIVADDHDVVEHGQPLMWVLPADRDQPTASP